MIRNLKALGLALVAMLAMSAVAASTASAQTQDLFTVTGGGNAIVTGTSHDNIFTITSPHNEFQCTTSTFAAKAGNGATQLTVEATYRGIVGETPHNNAACTKSGGGTVTIDMNTCDYVLTGKTDGKHGTETNVHAKVHIVCSNGGDHIVVTNNLCTIRVPAQTPTEGGVTYKNEAGGKVKINITVTGVTYTAHGGFCGLGGVATHGNNAHYSGTVLATGYTDGGGTKHPFTEGAGKEISVSF